MDLIKKLTIAIGLSILIGLAFGNFQSEKKYYLLFDTKQEITEKKYKQIRKNEYDSYGRIKPNRLKDHLLSEDIFNYKWALNTGLGVLGLSLISIGLSKNRKE